MTNQNAVDYVFGRAARAYTEFRYRTRKSWSRGRRVIAKAEKIESKENPRYVVTSLLACEWKPRELYERLYCARGEMAQAQVQPIRLRLLKNGAHIRFTARRVVVSMASGYPWRSLFARTWNPLVT